MVAGENNNMTDEKLDSRSMPIIKSNDLEETISDFKMYIMGVKQAHLGLKAKPKLGNRKPGITDLMWLKAQEDHKTARELWEQRKCTAFSLVYKACSVDPEVKEIRNVFMKECEAEDKDPLPSALLEVLEGRFVQQKTYRLKDFKNQWDNFRFQVGENLEAHA